MKPKTTSWLHVILAGEALLAVVIRPEPAKHARTNLLNRHSKSHPERLMLSGPKP